MEELVSAVLRYQTAAIEVVGEADVDLAKHIADDASLKNQAIDFGLDLAAGDGAYIVGKLANEQYREGCAMGTPEHVYQIPTPQTFYGSPDSSG